MVVFHTYNYTKCTIFTHLQWYNTQEFERGNMFENKSKIAFAAALLGTLYTLYLLVYFAGGSDESGGTIAFAIIMPHFICNLLASIFAWFGFKGNKKGMMIASLVFFVLAIFTFFIYFAFDLPMVILSAIAISKVSVNNTQQ